MSGRAEHKGRIVELEAVRGFAAFYVFLGHLYQVDAPLLRMGQEAVMLFFALSGFVIHQAAFRSGSRQPFREYFSHRFRRIYPLFFLALVSSYLCWWICIPSTFQSVDTSNVVGNLCMLQDNSSFKRGVWFDTPMTNHALWSLSYEWWFYLLFYFVVVMVPSERWQATTAAAIAVCGAIVYQVVPNQACLFLGYFYSWWAGAELAREYTAQGRVTWRGQRMNLLFLLVMAAIWFVPVGRALAEGSSLRLGIDPVLQFRHAAASLALIVLGMTWYRLGLFGFRAILGIFAVFAPISYALYIFHEPIIHLVKYALPPLPSWVQTVIIVIALIPVAYLTDVILQKWINRVFERLVPTPRSRKIEPRPAPAAMVEDIIAKK